MTLYKLPRVWGCRGAEGSKVVIVDRDGWFEHVPARSRVYSGNSRNALEFWEGVGEGMCLEVIVLLDLRF